MELNIYETPLYVVYYISHYDDYKRAESNGDIKKIFIDKNEAYKYAFIKNLEYINDNFTDIDDSINDYLTNDELSYEDRHNFFLENFDEIFGDPEYTSQPTHVIYKVKPLKIDT